MGLDGTEGEPQSAGDGQPESQQYVQANESGQKDLMGQQPELEQERERYHGDDAEEQQQPEPRVQSAAEQEAEEYEEEEQEPSSPWLQEKQHVNKELLALALEDARQQIVRQEQELELQRVTGSERASADLARIHELEESQRMQREAMQELEEAHRSLKESDEKKQERIMELETHSLENQDDRAESLQMAHMRANALQEKVDVITLELETTRDKARQNKNLYLKQMQQLQKQKKNARKSVEAQHKSERAAILELTDYKSAVSEEEGTRMAQLLTDSSDAKARAIRLEQERRDLTSQLAEHTAKSERLSAENERLTRRVKELSFKDKHAADLLEHHEEVNATLSKQGEEDSLTLASLSEELIQARRQLEEHKALPEKVAELKQVVAQREKSLASRIVSLDREITAAKALAGAAVHRQALQSKVYAESEQMAAAERSDLLVLLAHSERRAHALQGQVDHYRGKENALKQKQQELADREAATVQAQTDAREALSRAESERQEAAQALGNARSRAQAIVASVSNASRNDMEEADGAMVGAPVDLPDDQGSDGRKAYETSRAECLSVLRAARETGVKELQALDQGERDRIAAMRRAVRQAEEEALQGAEARRAAAQAERERWRRPALLQAAAKACVRELLPWFGFGVVKGKPGAAEAAGASDGGLLVSTVSENGPAATAGLRVGDWLVRVDGKAVCDKQSLTALFAVSSAGDVLALTVLRGDNGCEEPVSLAVGSREACAADVAVVRRALAGGKVKDEDYDLPLLQPYLRALVPEDYPAGPLKAAPAHDRKQGQAGACAQPDVDDEKRGDEEEAAAAAGNDDDAADISAEVLAVVRQGAKDRLRQFVPRFGLKVANPRGVGGNSGIGDTVVSGVEAQGPAELAGVQPGDVIETVDGAPIPTRWAFQQVFATALAGDAVELCVRRGEEQLDLVLIVGSLRAPPSLVRTLRRLASGRVTQQDVDTGVVSFFSQQATEGNNNGAAAEEKQQQQQEKQQLPHALQTQQQVQQFAQRFDDEELVAAAKKALAGARPWLGWSLRARGGHGDIAVVAVDPEGPASRAGVRNGDTVHALNHQSVSTAQAVRTVLASASPGGTLPIVLQRRDGERESVRVNVGVQAWPQGASEWCRRVASGKVLPQDHPEAARFHAAGVLRLQRLPKQPPTSQPQLRALGQQSLGLPEALFRSEEEEKRLALERAQNPVPDTKPVIAHVVEAVGFAAQTGVFDKATAGAGAAGAGASNLRELEGDMLLPVDASLKAGDFVEVAMEL